MTGTACVSPSPSVIGWRHHPHSCAVSYALPVWQIMMKVRFPATDGGGRVIGTLLGVWDNIGLFW